MPQHDDEAVGIKYGLRSGQESPERYNFEASSADRNFILEQSTLLSQFQILGKFFLTQDELIVDNASLHAEEFCTIIELCLDHGFRGHSLLLRVYSCFFNCV